MNIVLWIFQIVGSLLYLVGGGYKTMNPDDVAKQVGAIWPAVWRGLGVFEVVGAVLLIVPAATKWMPQLTPVAAAALAIETLGLAALYASHSLKLTPANPLVYAVPM